MDRVERLAEHSAAYAQDWFVALIYMGTVNVK